MYGIFVGIFPLRASFERSTEYTTHNRSPSYQLFRFWPQPADLVPKSPTERESPLRVTPRSIVREKKNGFSWKVYHSSPKNWRSNDKYCKFSLSKSSLPHFYHHQSPPPQVATNLLSFTTMTISYLKSAQKKVQFWPGPHAVARRGCLFLGPAGGVITNSSPLKMMGFQ